MSDLVPLLAVIVGIATPLIAARWMDRPELLWQRDRWLMAVAGIGLLALGIREPVLGVALLAVLLWWRHPRALPSTAAWAGISGLWLLGLAMSASHRRWVVVGWLAVAVFQVVLIGIQWRADQRPMGTFGHRTLAGAYLALCLPLAVSVHWSLAVLLAVGLALSCSWVAWVASAVALAWLYPWTGLVSLAVAGTVAALAWPSWTVNRLEVGRELWIDRWLSHYIVRGIGLDGLRARTIAWSGLVTGMTWRGHGPGGTSHALMHGNIRAGLVGIHGGHAHNDLLEYLYDYGLLGGCVVLLAVWRIAPHLRIGDPVSAAILAGLVLMQGTYVLQSPATGAPWALLTAWAVSA